MRLLLDENISWRIINLLKDKFKDIIHVTNISNERLSDFEIWKYAKVNNLIIVTYDADFSYLVSLYGIPPKIIWIKSGNLGKVELSDKLMNTYNDICFFAEDNNLGILEIL